MEIRLIQEKNKINKDFNSVIYLIMGSKWDDHTYKTLAKLYVFFEEKLTYIGETKIGLIDSTGYPKDKSTRNYIYNKFGYNNNIVEFKNLFYSCGQNIQFYQNLNSLLPNDFIDILKLLNDITVCDEINLDENPRNSNDVVYKSLLRFITPSDLNTHKNFVSKKEIIGGDNLKFNFKHDNEIFSFDCSSDLENSNLFAFIGPNGCGKSYTIDRILESILRKNYNLKGSEGLSDNIKRTTFSKIIKISFNINDNHSFIDNINIENEKLNIDCKASDYCNIFGFEELPKYDNVDLNLHDRIINTTFNNLLGIYNNTERLDLLSVFFDTLYPYFDFEMHFRSFHDINFDIDSEELFYEFKNKCMDLSNGMLTLFYSVTSLLNNVSYNSVILLDELENGLHAPLLNDYLKVLFTILNKYNCLGIVATHSAIVIQSLLSQNVFIFEQRYRNYDPIKLDKNKNVTFGASFDDIYKDAFKIEYNHFFIYSFLEMLVEKNSTSKSIDSFLKEKKINLGLSGEMYLAILKKRKYNE